MNRFTKLKKKKNRIDSQFGLGLGETTRRELTREKSSDRQNTDEEPTFHAVPRVPESTSVRICWVLVIGRQFLTVTPPSP
jgi:hypothetical protein